MHDSIIFNLREVWYDEMAAVIGMLYMYVYWAHMRYSTRCSLKLNLQNKNHAFQVRQWREDILWLAWYMRLGEHSVNRRCPCAQSVYLFHEMEIRSKEKQYLVAVFVFILVSSNQQKSSGFSKNQKWRNIIITTENYPQKKWLNRECPAVHVWFFLMLFL